MEEYTHVSPNPTNSTFHFPWSMEGADFQDDRFGNIKDIEPILKPAALSEAQYESCDNDKVTAWKVFSKDDDAGNVTMELLRNSWSLFKELHFEHWVEHVMGMPSAAVRLFGCYHHRLGFSLFSFLRLNPGEIEKYQAVAKNVESNDRFLFNTITHTLQSLQDEQIYGVLNLDVSLITIPLRAMLSQPDRNILRRLAVLKNRYKRYRTGTDIARGREFQTNTDFLMAFSEKTAARMAWGLSRDQFDEFRKISLQGAHENDHHLRRLALRWDQLYYDAEDVAASGEFDGKLLELVKQLYYLRNFFCLSAVLAGMSTAGIKVDTALAEIVDASGNYRLYRLKLHMDPSLPFLYPFMKELKRGNHEALRKIFSFIQYEEHLQKLAR
ncbi:hypothetical protein N7486_005040 [Penicillium sp. IBT 16267x]|nr:hypothetical protein N7486_005040 [Penicillium sp. IBT 16267x]